MQSQWLPLWLFVLAGLSAQETAPATLTGWRGRVVDEAGAPLADVVVCALPDGETFVTQELTKTPVATTDANGAWSGPRPKGPLLFVKKGCAHVAVPVSAFDFPVVLPRGRTLAGRVVDVEGKPVAGVRVGLRDWLRQARYRADASKVVWPAHPCTAVRTDAAGRFVLPGAVDAGMQIVVGERSEQSTHGPVALGDALELVHVPGQVEEAESFAYLEFEGPVADGVVVTGSTQGALPPHGAGLCFDGHDLEKAGLAGHAHSGTYGSRRRYGSVTALAADGTFRTPPLAPGRHRVELLLPRPLQQGQPDVVPLGEIEVVAGMAPIAFDLRPHLPALVRGRVRSPAPAGRMLVGIAVDRPKPQHNLGFTSFASPLATVAGNGAFAVRTPPGECTVFVIDLWTGMLLHRAEKRTVAAQAVVEVDLEVVAGAVDVALLPNAKSARWLELVVPDEWHAAGIDDIVACQHEYTKRLGCFVPRAAELARLWLPPTTASVWLCAQTGGELRPDAKDDVVIEPGKVASIALRPPQ